MIRNDKKTKFLVPLFLSLIFTGSWSSGWGQGSETFTNLPSVSSTSYSSRSWTGDDNVTWTAEGARTDQTITGKAICWGNSGTRNVISPIYSGGIGNLSFKYSRAFTGTSARSIEVYVNDVKIGNTITVSPTSNNIIIYSENINISGNIVLEIRSTGSAQVKVDDISWTGFSPASTPTLTSPTVSSITTNSATLGATISSDGGATLSSRGTVWGTSASPTGNVLAASGTSVDAFTHSRTSLTANTLYTYRGYAINSVGTGYSADGTFTTLPLAPTVGSGNSITASAFTANWSHPIMGSVSYTYTVEVDDDNAFGSINSTVSSIASSNTSQAITGLSPNTTYYYRVKAVNTQGSSVWSSTSAGVTTSSVSTPTLNPVTLASALTSTYGTASNAVSFAVGGSNLTTTITVTPQSGYKIATTSGGTYQSAALHVVNNTTVWVRFASTRAAGNYNSSIAVVLSGGGASSNVHVSTSSSGNTVTQKALTVTGLTAQNKEYDGLTTATATGTAALSGIVSPDAVSLNGTPTFTFVNATVGNGITVSTSGYSLTGAQSANYSLTPPTLAANITVRSLTITANNVSKVQGVILSGGAGSTAFTSSGLQNGETIGTVTITYGTAGATTGDGNTVGVYASQVTPSAATSGTFSSSNYSITYVAGSITVLETPIKVIGWDFNSLTGYGSSPQAATNSDANVTVGGLTRASGFGTGGTAASNAWGGTGNGTATFTVKANSGYTLSLSEISAYNIRRSGSGSTIGQWAYSLDGSNFTNIGSAITWGSTTTSSGNSQSAISLIGISALQNLSDATTVTFRIVNTGGTTGTWYLNNFQTGDDFIIQGYVKSVPQLSTPTAASISTSSATLGATVTSDGGAAITSRGTVYGTSASPTTNSLAEGGTSVAVYSHARTGLIANTLYYYRGYAVNSVGTGYSEDGTITTIHNAPTIGAGSNATSTTIDANWSAPAAGGSAAFTYEIQVDNNSDFSSPEFTQSNIASSSTTITATGLVSNTTYYYRVKANNEGGSSAWSATSAGYATLIVVNPTLSATALTVFGNSCLNETSSANSFTINGSALTSADISVASLSGYSFSQTLGGTYTNSLTLTQAGGSYSQTVYVKFTPTAVQSYDGNIVISGGGATSNVDVTASGGGISGTVTVTTTTATSIATITASTGGSSVSTTCGTITAKGVAYGTSVNPTTPATSNGTGTANFTSSLSGLTANTVYNYRAFATNSNAVTSYGSNLSFTTLHNAPNIGSGSGATTTGFSANWSAPIGGGSVIYTYEVAVSTSSTFASTLTTQSGISSASTSYPFIGLSSGTTYYYRVRANNSGGSSDWSAISTAISTQSVFENFEIGTKTSYTAADVTCSAGSWNMSDALIGTSADDRKFNSRSVRIRNTGVVSMNFDVTNGISNLTVYHALYGTDGNSTWRLEVSANSGSTWDAYVSSIETTSSTTLTAQTFNIDLCGPIRFRIVKLTGNRLNIDDIVLVEKAAIPSAPTASPQNFCTVLSPVQVSDLTATGTAIQWYSAVTGGTAIPTSTALASGTYYATQTIDACESATRTSVIVSLSNITPSITPTAGDLIWNGRTNTDFGISSNWYEYNGSAFSNTSAIPSSSMNIIIPANESICVLQQPTLTTGFNVKNLTIESGATLTLQSSTLSIAGNWENNGTFTTGTGTVAFIGTSDQTISNAAGETFTNLTINKATGVVLLANDVTIGNQLNLTNGILDLQASNLNMASNTINGGSATSYVRTSGNGVLKRDVSSLPILFPVGKSAYNPAVLTNSGVADLFSIRVYDYVSPDGIENAIQTSGQAVNRTWLISESVAGGSDVTLKMYWNAGEEVNGFVYSPGLMNVMHYNGSVWEELGSTNQGDSPYFIEKSQVIYFSPFTIGNANSALPVEFLEFKAMCNEFNETVLNWSTASEHNSDYFKVEKSEDAINWFILAMADAAGNTSEYMQYTFTDSERIKSAYYKLWQYDVDGSEYLLAIIHHDCSGNFSNGQAIAYPNPITNNALTIQLNDYTAELIQLHIYSFQGNLVHTQTCKSAPEITVSDLMLERGIYHLTIQQGTGKSISLKIAVQ
jgi:hypothetical protein